MPTVIKGQPTSAEVIQKLKAQNDPIILCFSCGKDSLATWIALEEAGIDFTPVYLWYVPHLKFVDDSLAYFEQKLGKKIHAYPHPSFYFWLNSLVAQAPERIRVIEAAKLPEPSYEQLWELVRDDLNLPNAWLADGVRASDSIVRRASFVRHGVMKEQSHKVSPIADWLKGEVYSAIERRGVELPIDYKIFGRSFDGLDYRFIAPMRDHLPDDFETLKAWFPLIETDIVRNEGTQWA